MPFAQRPKEPVGVDCSPCTVATVRACSQSRSHSVTAEVEHPNLLDQSPIKRNCRAIPPPGNAGTTPTRNCAKIEPGIKIGPVDCDAPFASVQRKPIKATANRDLPTIRFLKLRVLPDHFDAGACFFYSAAQSMQAPRSDGRLSDTTLWAKAIAVHREMCGFLVEESVLLVNRDLAKETWGARAQGGLPEHFASLAEHVSGSVVLFRTNMYGIVTSS